MSGTEYLNSSNKDQQQTVAEIRRRALADLPLGAPAAPAYAAKVAGMSLGLSLQQVAQFQPDIVEAALEQLAATHSSMMAQIVRAERQRRLQKAGRGVAAQREQREKL